MATKASAPESKSPAPATPAASTSPRQIVLDGNSLTPEHLYDIGYDWSISIALSDAAWAAVEAGRGVVDEVIERNQTAYGINTGFGNFASVIIPPDKLGELQENLIRSHAAGIGDLLSPERTRMMLALRINVLAKGKSGIRRETLEKAISALNKCCLPAVPCKGTVGASGDLAPLAHLALGLMGEGKMYNPTTKTISPAAAVLAQHGLTPVKLQAKEGLALINGTQFIASLGAEAVVRAERIARQADIVAALSLEALLGSTRPFHASVHEARPHAGQILTAGRLRDLLHKDSTPSQISLSHRFCGQVQDSYTMRCCPQVHGISHDTIRFVKNIITTELNSATDNPMVFAYEHAPEVDRTYHDHDRKQDAAAQAMPAKGFIISGGNFHGEYPAKAMDFLAIGIHEMASMSERRIERLVNPSLSHQPAFLVKEGGLNSGFMIAHCTAAALVSENKVLCHPSSVDSISTSAAKEDHVSMGGFAARKALQVVEHVETVIAIELLAAAQAIEFLRPLESTPALERVHKLVRSVVAPWDKDRYMAPDIEASCELLRAEKVWDAVKDQVDPNHYSL